MKTPRILVPKAASARLVETLGPHARLRPITPRALVAPSAEVVAVAVESGAPGVDAEHVASLRAQTALPILVLAAPGDDDSFAEVLGADAGVRTDAGSVRAALLPLQRLAETRAHALRVERLAELGSLVASVGHELTNPLTFVRANMACAAELLASGARDDEARAELAELVDETRDGVERMVAIVEDLRKVARSDAPPGRVELAACVSSALNLLRPHVGPQVSLRLQLREAAAVMADAGRVVQILVNLISNALDAVGDHGEVTVSARAEGDFVAIDVVDDGSGMEPATLKRCFEPFFTTKPPGRGTGLGLPLSRKMAEALGGRLIAHSAPGVGSRFSLFLPRWRDAELAPRARVSGEG